MRRKYFGLAIAALATLGPMQAWGGDREIAEQIIQRLKTNRDSGALKDFTLDMKVDNGVVLFRGNVSQEAQKDLVLKAAEGIDGIAKVVDEVSVTAAKVVKPKAALAVMEEPADMQPVQTAAQEAAVKPAPENGEVTTPELQVAAVVPAKAETPATDDSFSFREALAAKAKAIDASKPFPVMPGEIRRTAAVEPSNDAQIVSAVVAALSRAKDAGQLRGFGVDVKSQNGVLQLTGRASSPAQRNAIISIAESIPGVAGVREAIAIPTAGPSLPRLPEPPSLQDVAAPTLAPLPAAKPTPAPAPRVPARTASAPTGLPAMTAPYRRQAGPIQAIPASVGAPVAGQPVPMAPYNVGGAPRYDSPNLPNYAWPGYAAHPNYAALTYPQQYSPSAWPYIGPFYPYPQVPLGWRKVSLEWDDGWWFLDFTDR